MKDALIWITEHWFLGFILIFTALELTANLISRVLRFFVILIRGWPTAPYMDADGDIVYPDCSDSIPKDHLIK